MATMDVRTALARFSEEDGPSDGDAIERFGVFLEDVGPAYLTGAPQAAYASAMLEGVPQPYAASADARHIPTLLPEFLNDYLVDTLEGDPDEAHDIAQTMGRLIAWLAALEAIDPRAAKVATKVCRRAADQLPRAMVLGTLLDRQADRVDRSIEFQPGDVVEGLLRIDRVQPGMLWFADGVGPVPIGEAASRVAQVGWWVDIMVAQKGGFWHVLEVGPVYPERILHEGPDVRRR